MASKSKGDDENGYRAEFVNLVRQYPNLSSNSSNYGYRNENQIINLLQQNVVDKVNGNSKKGKKLIIGDNTYTTDFFSFVINSKGDVASVKFRGEVVKRYEKKIAKLLKAVNFGDTPFGSDEVKVPVMRR